MNWKKVLVASVVGCSVMGTSFAAWQEKEVVPAEYEKIAYNGAEKLFWLSSSGEEMPSQYHQLGDKTRVIPVGKELVSYKIKYYQNKPLLQIRSTGSKEEVGLIDLNGTEVLAPIKTKELLSYQDSGIVRTKEGLFEKGELILPAKKDEYFYQESHFEDGWYSNKRDKNKIFNRKGETLFEVPYTEEFWILSKDFVYGKSNGKDGKPKGYRLWNWENKEITPIEVGFQDVSFLTGSKGLNGMLGKTKAGWAFYPYEGDGKFGSPEPMAFKFKGLSNGSEVSPGLYSLYETGKYDDLILDLKSQKSYPKADRLVANGTRLVQEEIVQKKSFIPLIVPISGGGFLAMGDTIRGNERLRYRVTGLDGVKIIDLWESTEFGEKVMINRKKGETRIYDYNGNVLKEFKSTKEGYIPMVGKYKNSGEADEPLAGSMWPGDGKYQPYFDGTGWGILDKDTGVDYLAPDAKYGYIISVDKEGKRFWTLFGSGEGKERRYGVKQFDLVQ
ncbi:MAG: hypothetical protein KBA38_03230 [Negativicutes bacterium]|nr:hypothetical protein [Negativicutes bacterium]